ncbi:transglycosylase domain-containing protein [Streptomonospora nanhaiensis]|uniref:transglycosylase domain-containing protein n=4 Tax=Streptomonospora nanhaiensis TaxID=1323731 RepID=UPI001C3891AC|nr:transglycosylase domain-containing protein [Streptomonospora nanhaiensis]MBV2364071.1 penicillin-binding protein [Streptomonospora nanhaiensis]
MSTERRRNAGGRRRASGPADGARGNGGRRRAQGPAGDERSAGRRRPPADDNGGFWDEGGRGAGAGGAAGGGRRRPPAGDDGFWDDERPRRRSEDGDRDRGRSSGARSEAGPRSGGRRRAAPERGRRAAAAHGARSEGRGGGRRRAGGDDPDEYDDRGPVKRFFAKAWKPALITCALMFVAGVAVLGIAYANTPDPRTLDQQDSAQIAATTIKYENGSEAVTTGELNRVIVQRENIPQSVVNGVLAAEQRNFYEEPGISISGTMRAVLTAGAAGGGSTITQQMSRNYYDTLSQERSYTRKLREILISIKAGQTMHPDEILEKYLNTIYFGRQAYGVQAAAQAYFGKDVSELNDAEGAFIGAIIQQPGNFENVEGNKAMEDVLRERWDYVRDGLVTMHEENPDLGLPASEADKLEFPETIPYGTGDEIEGQEGYIRDAVINELQTRYDLSPNQIATAGYTVETSLDPKLMTAAEEAFAQTLPDMPPETVQGLAAVVPQTGEIRAFYGGTDFTQDPNNSLTLRAQAGSAFKPYVLAAGLEQNISLRSEFNGDSPQEFPGVGEPIQNDSNKDWGQVDLVESTAHSINTSFVQLAIEVGPPAVVDIAKAAGIREEQFETAEMGPNIALGTYQVTALDQAAGFATFANGGVHMPQHMITKVTNANGEEIQPNDAQQLEEGTPAFSEETAIDATYAMTQVVENGGGDAAALPDGRPVAGKTGTSNSAKSAWFVGYTPQLATAVGLSRDDGEALVIPGVNDVYGGTTSAKIWRAFMAEAMKGQEVEEFADPVWKGEEGRYGPTPEPSITPSEEPSETASETPSTTPSQSPTQSPPTTPPTDDDDCDGLPWECEDEQDTGSPEPPGPPDGDPDDTGEPPGWFRRFGSSGD